MMSIHLRVVSTSWCPYENMPNQSNQDFLNASNRLTLTLQQMTWIGIYFSWHRIENASSYSVYACPEGKASSPLFKFEMTTWQRYLTENVPSMFQALANESTSICKRTTFTFPVLFKEMCISKIRALCFVKEQHTPYIATLDVWRREI